MLFRSCFGDAESDGDSSPPRNIEDCSSFDSSAGIASVVSSTPPEAVEKQRDNVVLEIVGAYGLSFIKSLEGSNSSIDSFCVVKVGDKTVHRTKVIPDDPRPIWTVKTQSLCLLPLAPSQKVTVELCCKTTLVPGKVVKAIATKTVLGSVTFTTAELLGGMGERQEYCPVPEQPKVILAIRSRRAIRQDFMHFHDIDSRVVYDATIQHDQIGGDHAADTDFKQVSRHALLKAVKKTVKVGEEKKTAYRVWPFPDPDNPIETEYMTKEQLREVAMQPSKQWVEAGCGDFGHVYLEILGCDNLPNMDTEYVTGLTDAFVATIFEDSFVRSSVVHDSLYPRWVPWAHRAFKFQIKHPSSILFLGVFDYDEGPLEQHDPIGRVVIHLDKFETGTVYTLKYPLYHGDTQEEEDRGTITLRLRIDWNDETEVIKAQSFVAPPRFMVNVKSNQSWRVLRYITRGSVDMTEITTQSVKLYINELISYWRKYCYLWDVVFSIWLWRGRTELNLFGKKRVSVWFPIDSVFLLGSFVLAIERPDFIPSIFLYAIAYALLANNYYLSSHPDPWSRVRSFRRITTTKQLGLAGNPNIRIEPEPGRDEKAHQLRLLDEYKMHRVTGFLYEFMMTGLTVYRVYSKTTPVDISTVKEGGNLFSKLYVNYLRYLHLMFRMWCNYIRLLRNFVNWNVHSTYKFTMNLLLLATAWAFFPYKHLAIWPARGFVWLFFGPWVKLLDTFFIHKYYRTKEDLLRDGIPETTEEMKEDIARRPNILDPILKSSWVQKMGYAGRVVVEDNLKLQDFRELKYGKYCERVPAVDTSRFQCIPASSSRAQPYGDGTGAQEGEYKDLPEAAKKWTYVPGQKLEGVMVPVQTVVERDDPLSSTGQKRKSVIY